jgi:signal transduction histidine kinase
VIFALAFIVAGVIAVFVAVLRGRTVDPRIAFVAVPVAALLLLVGGRGGAGGAATIAVVVFLAWLAWFVLFSGSVRTATPEFRAKLIHIAFLAFFTIYALGIGAWLTAGLVAAVTGHSESLHERMHAYGGAPDVLEVHADDIAPFSIDGSRRIREMTFRANSRAQILFTNNGADPDTSCRTRCSDAERDVGVAIEHNLAIYRFSGEPVFVGQRITPVSVGEDEFGEKSLSATITYSFDTPAEGIYSYRCDVHPLVMRGRVRVLPPDAPVTEPAIHQGTRDMARRIAEVSHEAEDVPRVAMDYAFSLVSMGLGIFLVLLRPHERMARVFGVAMIGTAAAYNLQSHAALAVSDSFDTLHFFLHPITGITYIYALVLFPDGHLIPRFTNRFVRLGYRIAFFFAAMMLLGITGAILPDFGQHPAALVLTFGMAIPVIGMIAQSLRMRRAHSSEARQQSRLLLLALGASFAFGLILLVALGINLRALINPTLADPAAIGAADARAFRVFQPLFVVIPVALFIGILRFRLWDIDLVIRRTIVYAALAGFIGAVYVGVVVVLGGAVGGRAGLSIAATVLVAVVFDPLRSRLQHVANRLVYGERASPYEVMADVSRRLAGMTSAAQMLPAIAESVARGVGAETARATLFLPSGGRQHGTFPPEADDASSEERTITLSHHGEPVGELAVGKRPGDPIRAAENRLLEAVGSQVAVALHSLRLAERLRTRLEDLKRSTVQLEASRRRIVSAQDAERSRLERDIHDRVEIPLLQISETVGSAERVLASKSATAVELLEQAAAEANRVQDTLRDVARGVFPPLLADKGVAAALESRARKESAPVAVRTAGEQDRFDHHSEAAVYFCCVEAIRSAVRRTDGSTIEVELGSDDGWITFDIRDRAHGLTDAAMAGADLQLMVDRMEAVGGRLEVHSTPEGTTVSGRVPAQPPTADHSAASRSGSNADFGT